MELCRGGSLIDVINRNKAFSELALAHIMKQLLSALAYLQAKNMVHRDIKLDNIVALSDEKEDTSDRFYSIKIIDFGTAVKINKRKTPAAGTRYYMAPETFKGVLNAKSDVWSSGVFLYLLFTGKFPFQAGSMLEME
jgi:serine/threonine protein kinase